MSEQEPVDENTANSAVSRALPPAAYRVLSVRTSEETRAQLEVLAQLNNRSVTEETRVVLEHWVERCNSDPIVLKRAEHVCVQIEHDADTKRRAIAAVLGGTAESSGPTKPAGRSTRSGG